jgi:Asp-tRNA(Asn)/Glu-tRNA(Gln) amidotransferase A subunit family amidase
MICSRLDLRKSTLLGTDPAKRGALSDLSESTAKFFMKAPDNNVLQFALSNKVILVEGDAEFILLEELYAKHAKGSTLATDGVHVISVGGTSFKRYLELARLLGVRVAVVRELQGEGFEPGVEARFAEAVAVLTDLGATVTEVSCPHFEYALAAYYLIAPSEASSNLARFDSVRYGLRVGDDGERSLEEVMALTRAQGFGAEVKRRIILGTYALSSGYYDAYYGQAQKVRTLITQDFTAAFEQADVLIAPTCPTVAFPLGAKLDDPLAMYRQDVASIPSNLYGGPAMSIPAGLSEGLPVGLQVMAPTMRDDLLYQVGGAFEAALPAAVPALDWERS